jgi:hypothetical protein
LTKLSDTTQAFRPGQIIQGKIIKLFPNNKAQIQLGSQQMVAQLEAALEVGARYHFQVQGGDKVVYLKVVGESLNLNSQMNLVDLLQQLGLKQTKLSESLVQGLLNKKIPFDKQQLQRALPLLEGAPNKVLAHTVLHEMIASKLPITKSTFQALYTRMDGTFSANLSELQGVLQRTDGIQPIHKQTLMNQITQFTGIKTESELKQIVQLSQNPSVFNLLKATGSISRDMQFSEWSNQVKMFLTGDTSSAKLDFPKVAMAIEQLVQNQGILKQNASSILGKWGETLHTSIAKGVPISDNQFSRLQLELQQNIGNQNRSNPIQNTPMDLRNLVIDLEILANTQIYKDSEQLIQQTIKNQFLEQVSNVLHHTGLQYEKSIVDEKLDQTNTLKGLLLQLIQQADGNVQDQASKLLHFINGMQLQSLSETDNFLQASLLIPSEKLGLKQDMEISFEGQKNEAGEINPDYCRIVFYLDLQQLQKTVIDMNVQKRNISITILNDQEISGLTKSFKPLLKEGLERINYQLSTITCKPLTNHEEKAIYSKKKEKQQASYRGVDFRI